MGASEVVGISEKVKMYDPSVCTTAMSCPEFQHQISTSEVEIHPPEPQVPNNKYLRKRRVTFGGVEEFQTNGVSSTESRERRSEGTRNRNGKCNDHSRTKESSSFENEEKPQNLDRCIQIVDIFVENRDNADHGSIMTIGRKGKGVGEFQDITNISHLPYGQILVTDMVNNRLQRINKLGETVDVFTAEEIKEPVATCVIKDGHIAMTSRRHKCVFIFSSDGEYQWSFGSGFFQAPSGICVDNEGNFIVTDVKSHRVSLHNSSGQFVKYFGNQAVKEQQLNKPRHVCISCTGQVIVSDSGNHAIKIFDNNGRFIRSFGKFGNENGRLKTPYGVCFDKYGQIIVADHYNNRVSLFTIGGHFVRHLVTREDGIIHPQCVTVNNDMEMFVSHGHLKASELKVFKLIVNDENVKIS